MNLSEITENSGYFLFDFILSSWSRILRVEIVQSTRTGPFRKIPPRSSPGARGQVITESFQVLCHIHKTRKLNLDSKTRSNQIVLLHCSLIWPSLIDGWSHSAAIMTSNSTVLRTFPTISENKARHWSGSN